MTLTVTSKMYNETLREHLKEFVAHGYLFTDGSPIVTVVLSGVAGQSIFRIPTCSNCSSETTPGTIESSKFSDVDIQGFFSDRKHRRREKRGHSQRY